MPDASHAGTIQRRTMLFGEIGLPDQVENISASGSRRLTRARQSAVSLMACARDALRIPPVAVSLPENP
jgi:hypothetical protein